MKRLFIWFTPLILVLPLSWLLVGCWGGSKSNTFTVATFTWAGYAPIHLAKEKGFFKGIDVQIKMIEDTSARRSALSTGQVQGSVDILDSFVIARSAGVPAKVVLKLDDSMGGDGIVVKKGVNSLEDLKGKTVAFAKDQPSHFFLLALLKREGMSMADLKARPMNEADQAGSAFVSGSVDAAVTWEPWLTKASQTKDGKILTTSKETPGLIVDVFTVREDFLAKNPETVRAFIKGWLEAIEFWKSNPAAANKIMADAMKMKPAQFAAIVKGIKYGDLQSNQDFFKGEDSKFKKLVGQANEVWSKEGLIKRPIDPAAIDGSSLILEEK